MEFIVTVGMFGLIGAILWIGYKIIEFVDEEFGSFPSIVLFFMSIGAGVYLFDAVLEDQVSENQVVCSLVQYDLDVDVPFVDDEDGFVVCEGKRVYLSVRNYLIEGES
jgi:hypothetical protein